MFKSAITLLFIFLLSNPLLAGVHRWVDEQGNVHFSDTPPRNQSSEEVKIQAAPTASGSHYKDRLERQKEYLQGSLEKREERRLAKEEEKLAKEKNQKRCANAKLELELNHRRLVRANPDGSRHYLDDNERESYFADLREKVKANCE